MYDNNMKPITINVSEPVYRAYRQYAQLHDRTTSELIREAMEVYADHLMQPRQTIRGLPPLSLGKVVHPLQTGDDLLMEMSHD